MRPYSIETKIYFSLKPMNTMQPKVTIVLPVYNVEPYLRQCLDSVMNQTMQDIQIICVNDGSTDGSRTILQEYADGDSRIEIIDQENQGGGSARNAAYPFIRGKYTYFVDPDDWLELDLCQQCCDQAETTGADFVFVRHTMHTLDLRTSVSRSEHSLIKILCSPEDKNWILMSGNSTWQRFWRTDFLVRNQIKFTEGKRPSNDIVASWKGSVLASRIIVLNIPLYHHRSRPGSYQRTINETHFIIIETMEEIKKMLQETGYYDRYKEVFFLKKLTRYQWVYERLPRSLRARFIRLIRRSWTDADRKFYRSAAGKKLLGKKCVRFYRLLVDGGWFGTLKYHWYSRKKSFYEMIKLPERLLRCYVVRPLKTLFGIKGSKQRQDESEFPVLIEAQELQHQADSDSLTRQVPEKRAA